MKSERRHLNLVENEGKQCHQILIAKYSDPHAAVWRDCYHIQVDREYIFFTKEKFNSNIDHVHARCLFAPVPVKPVSPEGSARKADRKSVV